MYTLLVPIDFTDISISGLEFAGFIAKMKRGQIVLLYALHPKNIAVGTSHVFDMTDYEYQKELYLKKLEDLAIKYRQQHIYTKHHVTLGFLNDAIEEAIKEHAVNLIVTGTHGASGLEANILGTRSLDIAKTSNIPTVIVPKDWKVSNFDKIVYASDFRFSDLKFLKEIVDLAKSCNAQVTILHLSNSVDKEENDALMYWFKELCTEEVIYDKMNFEVVVGESLLETLDSFVKNKGYDLVCMAMKKRNFIEKLFEKSQSKEIAFAAKFPVWLVNENN
jgi:nucleotide-binding universal stress UspA family protein